MPKIIGMRHRDAGCGRAAAQALARLRREQAGFSLVELMVVTLIGILVLGAAVMFSEVGQRGQADTANHTGALAQQRAGLELMTRELRQAKTFTLISPQVVEIDTMVRSGGGTAAPRRVRFACSGGSCRRSEGPEGGPVSGSAVPKVVDVVNTNVFQQVGSNYVSITLDVNVPGRSNPIALEDGVDMRNTVHP